MNLYRKESTKPNQKDLNVGFLFFKVRLSFSEKSTFLEMRPPSVPHGSGVPVSGGEGGASPFCVSSAGGVASELSLLTPVAFDDTGRYLYQTLNTASVLFGFGQ